MIKIGEFSKLAKTTIKTLRFYDDIGLFKPSFVDDNGYRYYEIEQLNVLSKIKNLRDMDFSIEEIESVLAGCDVDGIYQKHLAFLKEEYKKKSHQISLLKNLINGGNNMRFEADYKTIGENIVYFRHGVIKTMADLTGFVLEAGEECGKHNPGLECKGYCYVTYAAEEYKEEDIELEYAEAVTKEGVSSEHIAFRKDPSIKAVTVASKGPYVNLKDAYAFILNHCKEKGLEIAGPIREVYIHGCWDKESEDDYLTEIQVPIK